MIRAGSAAGADAPVSAAKPRFAARCEPQAEDGLRRVEQTPMEFAVEANRLMEVSLEGAVG